MARIFIAVLGVIIFVLGNILFALPNHISAGGITGFSTLLYYTLHWNIGLVYLLLNLPLFLIAWKVDKGLFTQSLGSMLLSSILIGLLEPLSTAYGVKHIWIGSIAGGVIMGIGLGIMGMVNASLGGGSLAGKMINMKFKIPLSLAIFLVDCSVYPFFLIFLGVNNTVFCLLLTLFSALGVVIIEKLGGTRIKPFAESGASH